MDLGVPKSISLPPSMSGFGKFHVQDDSTQRLHPQILVPTKMVIYFGTPNFRKYIYILVHQISAKTINERLFQAETVHG